MNINSGSAAGAEMSKGSTNGGGTGEVAGGRGKARSSWSAIANEVDGGCLV